MPDILNKEIKSRIIEISYKRKLSHLGSCLTAVDMLVDIFDHKRKEDLFIMSAGHAGLALYAVLEHYYDYDALELFDKHGVHPMRDVEHGIMASSGSLGHGIGIAIGYALTNRKRRVYCYMTDGEMAEGSVYEAMNTARSLDLRNLELYINCNGWSAYKRVYNYHIADYLAIYPYLNKRLYKTVSEFPFLEGLDAHYYTMNEDDYKLAKQILWKDTTPKEDTSRMNYIRECGLMEIFIS